MVLYGFIVPFKPAKGIPPGFVRFSSIVAQRAWLATASKVEVYMKQGWASVSKAGAINLLDLVVFKWVRGEVAQLWVKEGG